MTSVLISETNTNHPPESYALATAGQLVPSDGYNPQGISPLRIRELQVKVALILTPYFASIIGRQRQSLEADPHDLRLASNVVEMADTAAGKLQTLSRNSFWHAVTMSDEWLNTAIGIIGTHLMTAVHVENLVHADNHPDVPEAKAYKTKYQGS